MKVAEIAFPLPLWRTFHYTIPDDLLPEVRRGLRVVAPFGPVRHQTGVVLGVSDIERSEFKLKAIARLADPNPLPDDLLDLAAWLSKTYCTPFGECLKAVFPQFVKQVKARKSAAEAAPPADLIEPGAPAKAFELTPGQKAAGDTLTALLDERRFRGALVFGVPASGKTEVYLKLIRRAVENGGQALFLLPEIALTQPFFDELSGKLPVPVVSWHSKMTPAARRKAWFGLQRGERQVVVGARSAALLPFKDLRLVVVDEEQDESYKQDQPAPHYHARETAIQRAREAGALAVLGSATPSLEAIEHAHGEDWTTVVLRERVSKTAAKPVVEVVDSTKTFYDLLSPRLVELMQDRLKKREQIILLINRRGFSNFLACKGCAWVARCPKCEIALVHHKEMGQAGEGDLKCHHCGFEIKPPVKCPRCREGELRFQGTGTQRIETKLAHLFKGAKVLRLDSDTSTKKDEEGRSVYDVFKAQGADILVGTKLVSKGFNFPDCTLVGIVDADTMLQMPDFRAAERTVQMLLQAIGRAGRAEKPGRVVLQTAQPGHYAIDAVVHGDYARFVKEEREQRRLLHYPPHAVLVRILFEGKVRQTVSAAAEAMAEAFAKELASPELEMQGPAPPLRAKMHGKFRFHLMLKVRDPRAAKLAFDFLKGHKPSGAVKAKIQVDPYDML